MPPSSARSPTPAHQDATHATAAPQSTGLGAAAAGLAILTGPPAAGTRDSSSPRFAGASRLSSASSPKMLFADLYRSTKSPLSRLRQNSHPLPASTSPDFDADLVSKDKVKQKEAIKKFLAARIRSDWEFKWPRSPVQVSPRDDDSAKELATTVPSPSKEEEEECSAAKKLESPDSNKPQPTDDEELVVEEISPDDGDNVSIYSTVSEDLVNFRPRLEWSSDISDDDTPVSPSAYRFDTPDAVGVTVQTTALAKQAKRRREIRAEESWNSGLACFNARRDAWTGAKTVRVKPKPPSTPASPSSARRLSFFRFSSSTSPPLSPSITTPITSPLLPTATHTSGETTAVASSDGECKEPSSTPKTDTSLYPIEILLPTPPPLLPAANPMRASITPATYPSIYDRIVVHSMTPACPVNLADVLRSCVAGWKRDGEWPPRLVDMPTPVVAVRKKKRDSNAAGHHSGPSGPRRLSFGFLGRRESSAAADSAAAASPTVQSPDGRDDENGKGIRKSLQRVLGLGHERTGSTASQNGVVAG